MEPLGPLDSAFLSLETPNSPMHVAAVLVLDPPEGRRSLFSPTTRFAQLERFIAERVHLVPRLRQRVVHVPFGLHHPLWVDDPTFRVEDHVRRASVPHPGGDRELDELVAEIMERPFDPERPLWEIVVVEGLAGERTALICKLHHSILDGVSGSGVLGAFFDRSPRNRFALRSEPVWIGRGRHSHPWPSRAAGGAPADLPSQAAVLHEALKGVAHQPEAAVVALGHGWRALTGLFSRDRQARDASMPPGGVFRGPRAPFNGRVSPLRRFASVSLSLDDARLVRRAFGTTVNDVILAVIGSALRQFLDRRDELPESSLVAIVPVSRHRDSGLRKARSAGADLPRTDAVGNRISAIFVSMATDVWDPVERLRSISSAARTAKSRDRSGSGELLQDVARMTVPAVSSRAVRWARGLGLFDRLPPVGNLVVSNVPGPSRSLWCAGSRVVAFYPVGPVAEGLGLNVTVATYGGMFHVGLLGCRKLVPDLEELPVLVQEAMTELMRSALGTRRAAG